MVYPDTALSCCLPYTTNCLGCNWLYVYIHMYILHMPASNRSECFLVSVQMWIVYDLHVVYRIVMNLLSIITCSFNSHLARNPWLRQALTQVGALTSQPAEHSSENVMTQMFNVWLVGKT